MLLTFQTFPTSFKECMKAPYIHALICESMKRIDAAVLRGFALCFFSMLQMGTRAPSTSSASSSMDTLSAPSKPLSQVRSSLLT